MQNNVFLILSSSLSLYTFSVCYCCNIFLQNRLAFILRPIPTSQVRRSIIHEYHTPSLSDPFKECPRDESMQVISMLLPSSSWSPDSFLLSGANPHIQAVTCGKLHLCVGRRYSWRPQHARHIPLHWATFSHFITSLLPQVLSSSLTLYQIFLKKTRSKNDTEHITLCFWD